MGAFGRAGEKIKQAFGCGVPNDAEWKPTSNARNQMMLKDLKEFAVHVRRMHGDVTMWRETVTRGLNTMKGVLEAPLPKAYCEGVTGVTPVDPDTPIVGQGARTQQWQPALEQMQEDIKKVLSSLEGWLNSYKEIKAQNKKCDVLKFDFDAQHREAAKLADKYQKILAANKTDDDLKFKVASVEDKRNRLAQRYAETEAGVFNALLAQVRDSSGLRDYVVESLLSMKIVFEQVYSSVDARAPVKPPMLPPMAAPVFKTVNTIDAAGAAAIGSSLGGSALMDNRASLRMSNGAPLAPGQQSQGGAAQPVAKAPAWYDEARSQAGMPIGDEADSDDDGNPFGAKGGNSRNNNRSDTKSNASNPFGPSKANAKKGSSVDNGNPFGKSGGTGKSAYKV